MELKQYYSNINFNAKFLYSDSLVQVARYAVEKGKFEKLNTARKNIDNAFLQTRLRMDICYTGDYPTVVFSRFQPKKNVLVAKLNEDYELTKQTEFIASKVMNPLKFALEKLIKLGNDAPHNKMYKNVVIDRSKTKDFLFPI